MPSSPSEDPRFEVSTRSVDRLSGGADPLDAHDVAPELIKSSHQASSGNAKWPTRENPVLSMIARTSEILPMVG